MAFDRPAQGIEVPAVPRAVLEAGDETWVVLRASIVRRLTDLAPGDVLEIISSEPTARIEVAEWCRHSGNQLLRLLPEGDRTCFWIRKAQPGAG